MDDMADKDEDPLQRGYGHERQRGRVFFGEIMPFLKEKAPQDLPGALP
jgi:hypothetical protein